MTQALGSRARKLEFDTTLHYLDKHLPPRATLLELDAGEGDFSFHFAERGHQVLATDPRSEAIEALFARTEAASLATLKVRQSEPTRLDSLSDWDFQAVLCFGPYWRLRAREQRRRCLLECRRVVHDSGVVALTYLNRDFAVAEALRSGVSLNRSHWEALLRLDDSRNDFPVPHWNLFHLTTPEAMEAEVRSCGFEVAEHTALTGAYDSYDESIPFVDEDNYLDFFSYHLKAARVPSARGASRQGLVILKKG